MINTVKIADVLFCDVFHCLVRGLQIEKLTEALYPGYLGRWKSKFTIIDNLWEFLQAQQLTVGSTLSKFTIDWQKMFPEYILTLNVYWGNNDQYLL